MAKDKRPSSTKDEKKGRLKPLKIDGLTLEEALRGAMNTQPPKTEPSDKLVRIWVGRIARDTALDSSPWGIREHRDYLNIFSTRESDALRGLFSAMKSSPVIAITIASDLLGDRAPETSMEDRLDFDLLLAKWTEWGRTHHYL